MGANRNRELRDRRDVTGNEHGRERRIFMLGRIDEPVEGGAVAARRAMRRLRRFDAVVMPMHHMRHRIQRKRQHHGDEEDS